MYDLSAMEISESVQDSFRYFSKHLLSCSSTELLDLLIYAVQAAAFTEFHCDRYRTSRLVHKRTIVTANVLRGAILIKVEFSNDLLLHVWIWIGGYDLYNVY